MRGSRLREKPSGSPESEAPGGAGGGRKKGRRRLLFREKAPLEDPLLGERNAKNTGSLLPGIRARLFERERLFSNRSLYGTFHEKKKNYCSSGREGAKGGKRERGNLLFRGTERRRFLLPR